MTVSQDKRNNLKYFRTKLELFFPLRKNFLEMLLVLKSASVISTQSILQFERIFQ